MPITVCPGLLRLCLGLAIVATMTLYPGSGTASPVRIVALGDSNTYGYGVPRDETYPAQLQQKLRADGYDVEVINKGVNGDMTFETLGRLEKAIPDDTDAVILFLGRNDWRKGTPVVTIAHNIEVIVGHLRNAGLEVLLVGFAPNDFSAIARKYDTLYYDNFFDGTTILGRKRGRYKLRGDIGAHLNPAGYAVIVKRMTPSVEALIGRVNGTATN